MSKQNGCKCIYNGFQTICKCGRKKSEKSRKSEPEPGINLAAAKLIENPDSSTTNPRTSNIDSPDFSQDNRSLTGTRPRSKSIDVIKSKLSLAQMMSERAKEITRRQKQEPERNKVPGLVRQFIKKAKESARNEKIAAKFNTNKGTIGRARGIIRRKSTANYLKALREKKPPWKPAGKGGIPSTNEIPDLPGTMREKRGAVTNPPSKPRVVAGEAGKNAIPFSKEQSPAVLFGGAIRSKRKFRRKKRVSRKKRRRSRRR